MNLVTVTIFDINQQKVVTKFLDMCLSKASIATAIFASIDNGSSLEGHERLSFGNYFFYHLYKHIDFGL